MLNKIIYNAHYRVGTPRYIYKKKLLNKKKLRTKPEKKKYLVRLSRDSNNSLNNSKH